jgi:hypothetical protein
MSAACAGSVLTLGIDANSTSWPKIARGSFAGAPAPRSLGHHLPPSIEITCR